jgi:acetylglutamate kinase
LKATKYIHGGGKSATKLAESMGLVPQMIDGRRITDAAMLEL